MCGFCNTWVCECVGFVIRGCVYVWVWYCVGVCMCGFCNVWVCVYMWVFLMCGCFDNRVVVLVVRVLVFTVFCIVCTVLCTVSFFVYLFLFVLSVLMYTAAE